MRILSKIKRSNIDKTCYIGKFTTIIECEIGSYSYIGSRCRFFNTKVGKYCSLGSGIKIIFGNHPTKKFVSTSPYFYSANVPKGKSFVTCTKYNEFKYVDEEKQYRVCIENDVWIGNESLILEGVTIGNGAIIAAGSVVVRDVRPYEIVGGNPAKHIRYRFKQEEIDQLLKINWWNKEKDWILKNADSFDNVNKLMETKRNE